MGPVTVNRSCALGLYGLGLHDLLAKMVTPIANFAVMPHHHRRRLVAQDITSLGQADSGFKQVGADCMAVEVRDHVGAELECFSYSTKATGNRVLVPRVAFRVAKE